MGDGHWTTEQTEANAVSTVDCRSVHKTRSVVWPTARLGAVNDAAGAVQGRMCGWDFRRPPTSRRYPRTGDTPSAFHTPCGVVIARLIIRTRLLRAVQYESPPASQTSSAQRDPVQYSWYGPVEARGHLANRLACGGTRSRYGPVPVFNSGKGDRSWQTLRSACRHPNHALACLQSWTVDVSSVEGDSTRVSNGTSSPDAPERDILGVMVPDGGIGGGWHMCPKQRQSSAHNKARCQLLEEQRRLK